MQGSRGRNDGTGRKRDSTNIYLTKKLNKTMGRLNYQKYQNKNEQSTAYQKWYGRAVIKETVGIETMAERIEQNCTAKRADVLAVLSELGVVVKDLLQDGNRVHLPYLGYFKLGLSTTGAESPEKFTANSNIKGVHVVFQPEVSVGVDGKRVKKLVQGVRLVEDNSYLAPQTPDETPQP